jgi:hypothetical protein
MNLLFAYFRAPWKAHVILAALFFAAAIYTFQTIRQTEVEKAAALAAPQPAAVALDAFTAADIHPADEVHVTGQINPAYNYTLTEHHTGKRDYDVVRRMFVLFGPSDAEDATVARAAVILPEEEVTTFINLLSEQTTGASDYGLIFNLNGAADTSPDLKSMAIEALGDEKLTMAPDFVFIEPWFGGRAAALAPDAETATTIPAIVASPGLLSVLMGIFGFRRARRQTAAALQMASAPIPAALMGMPRPNPTTTTTLTNPTTKPIAATPTRTMPASALATVTALSQGGSTLGKIVLAYAAIFITMFAGWSLAPVLLIVFTGFLIRRGMNVAVAAGTREAVNIGRNALQMAKGAPSAAPQTTAYAPPLPTQAAPPPATGFSPPAPSKSHAAVLPPAIRPGFSFRDLLPKRREPEPQENPYAGLAASIRDEHMRRRTP